MANIRPPLVGKRFLSVSSKNPLKLSRIHDWDWQAGWIRAASSLDPTDQQLQVLLEFDEQNWKERDWYNVFPNIQTRREIKETANVRKKKKKKTRVTDEEEEEEEEEETDNKKNPKKKKKKLNKEVEERSENDLENETVFKIFLVEDRLTVAHRPSCQSSSQGTLYPALVFSPLYDEVDLFKSRKLPVEFLSDRKVVFQEYNLIKTIQAWDPLTPGLVVCSKSERDVREWVESRAGQSILRETPTRVLGYRAEVYRAEGTTQWYTAVIVGHNLETGEFTVTDDTVLEEHLEHPDLVQLRILGDGVIECLLGGDESSVGSRRSRTSVYRTPRPPVQGFEEKNKKSRQVRAVENRANQIFPEKRGKRKILKAVEGKWKKISRKTPVSQVPGENNSLRNLELNSSDTDSLSPDLTSSQSDLTRDQTKEISSESDSDTKSNQSSASTASSRVSKVLKKSFKGKAVAIVKPFSSGVKKNTALYDFKSDEEGENRKSAISSESNLGLVKKLKNGKNSVSRKLKFGTELKSVRVRLEKYNSKNFGQFSKTRETEPDPECSTTVKSEKPDLVEVPECRPVEAAIVGSENSGAPDNIILTELTNPTISGAPETLSGDHVLAPAPPLVQPAPPSRNEDSLAKKQRMEDDSRSDSGVSTLRSDGARSSGDERSGSRSSAISDDRSGSRPSASHSAEPDIKIVGTVAGRSTPHSLIVDKREKAWREQESLRRQEESIRSHQEANLRRQDQELRREQEATLARHFQSQRGGMGDPRNPLLPPASMGLNAHAAASLQAQLAAAYGSALPSSLSSLPSSLSSTLSSLSSMPGGGMLPPGLTAQTLLQYQLASSLGYGSGLLGSPGSELLIQRERQIAQDRDRQLREKREQEHRERERLEKERQERERREREERERREREEKDRQIAEEDVNRHFQLSMEMVRKMPGQFNLFNQRTAGNWSNIPGIGGRDPESEQRQRFLDARSRDYRPPPPAHGDPYARGHPKDLEARGVQDPRGGSSSQPPQGYRQVEQYSKHPQAPSPGSYHRGPSPHHTVPPAHHRGPSPHGGPSPHHSGPSPHHSGPPSHHRGPSPHHGGPSPHHGAPSPHHTVPGPHHGGPPGHHSLPSPHHRGGPSPLHRGGPSPHLSRGISPGAVSPHSPQDRYAGLKLGYPQTKPYSPHSQGLLSPQPGSISSIPSIPRPKVASPAPGPVYGKPSLHSPIPRDIHGLKPTQPSPHPAHPPPAHSVLKVNPWEGASRPSPISLEPLPLDLGSSKRKPESDDPVLLVPLKTSRIEPVSPPGQLHRVTEPSTLGTQVIGAEATLITSVVNTAALSAGDVQDENSRQADPLTEEKKKPEPGGAGYVHKLKKAWMKSYVAEPSGDSNGGGGSKNGGNQSGGSGCNSSSTSPQLTRATPSPVGSTKSTGSGRGFPSAVKSAAEALRMNGHGSPGSEKKGEEEDMSSEEEEDASKPLPKPKKARGKPGPKPKGKPGPKPKTGPRKKAASESENSDSEKESDSSKKSENGLGKKRGRKPGKQTKVKEFDEPKFKKFKTEESPKSDPFTKPSISQLKKSGDSFLQDASCFEVAPKLNKCRECRWSHAQRQKQSLANIFCRFYAFRRLRYTKNGQIAQAGFCDPKQDAQIEDLKLWLPSQELSPPDMDKNTAEIILENLSSLFYTIYREEQEATNIHLSEDLTVAWKRVVQGVREMCDVCEATLFNNHWACGKCGFVVCIDCYRTRAGEESKETETSTGKDRDEFSWLFCTNRQSHQPDTMMLTQIIAGDALEEVNTKLRILAKLHRTKGTNGENGWQNPDKNSNGIRPNGIKDETDVKEEKEGKDTSNLRDLICSVSDYSWGPRDTGSISMNPVEDKYKFSHHTAHSWNCDGKVLRLEDPLESGNLELFKFSWKHSQPVIVEGIGDTLDSTLWNPSNFLDLPDHGFDPANPESSAVSNGQTLKKFFDGLDNTSRRPVGDNGEPMCLKLRDGWPLQEDQFQELLPVQCKDILRNLPLKEYMDRSGILNLASMLPECFVRLDLGPRLRGGYGKSVYAMKYNTSDTFSVCVYTGKDGKEDIRETLRNLKCDKSCLEKAGLNPSKLAALWTVFHPSEADKVKSFILKNLKSEGKVKPKDPLYDQTMYLKDRHLDKLLEEENIKPMVFTQLQGEGISIPAGAPFQVKFLQASLLIQIDSISPEHMDQAMHIRPSDIHRFDDRFQVKNLVFHSCKDALSVLFNQDKKK